MPVSKAALRCASRRTSGESRPCASSDASSWLNRVGYLVSAATYLVLAGIIVPLAIAYAPRLQTKGDATSPVAAAAVIGAAFLGGLGSIGLAPAAGPVLVFILALRRPIHRVVHSPRAAQALAATLAETLALSAAEGRLTVCISPAAAAPLDALPFAEIRIAETPDEPAMLAALGKPSPPV